MLLHKRKTGFSFKGVILSVKYDYQFFLLRGIIFFVFLIGKFQIFYGQEDAVTLVFAGIGAPASMNLKKSKAPAPAMKKGQDICPVTKLLKVTPPYGLIRYLLPFFCIPIQPPCCQGAFPCTYFRNPLSCFPACLGYHQACTRPAV